jgi:hypothetical protein
MSTTEYKVNKITYFIGTIGWEGPNRLSQIGDFFVPTYGLWAGPGWSGGLRVPKGDKANWAIEPCFNESLTGCTDPENEKEFCYSLVDAICKHHDWDYYQAELNGNNATMIMNADNELLTTIDQVSKELREDGMAEYKCTADGEAETYAYTGTFDSEEQRYLRALTPAFTIKLVLWDAAQSLWSGAVNTFKSIWSIFGSGETTYTDTKDPSRTVSVREQNNGILYECYDMTTNTDRCWTLGLDTENACILPTISFGDGSIKPTHAYEYLGNNRCSIHGGSGKDRITVTNNGAHQAELTLEGGGGEDRYYFAFGSGDHTVADSGENHIYRADENNTYYRMGNFYKGASADIWETPDGTNQITHASPWKIIFEDGTVITLQDGSNPTDFGINLLDTPSDPTTTTTILGDLDPLHLNDTLYDSSGNDRVDSHGLTPGVLLQAYVARGNPASFCEQRGRLRQLCRWRGRREPL